jgi:predicted Na+-dependent transporter
MWMPSWAQRLQWLFFASFAVWFAVLMFGDPFEHPYIAMGLFAMMMVPATVRAYFMMHAVGRGELNPFTTLSTRKRTSE